MIFSIVRLKKSWKLTGNGIVFLNAVFLLFILISIAQILIAKKEAVSTNREAGNRTTERQAGKGNIYLLIADEYAGRDQLEKMFGYTNDRLKTELEKRGFQWVRHSRSNYNFTPFSMASIFQMDYLKEVKPNSSETSQRNLAFSYINSNQLVNILKEKGYEVINASLFKIADKLPVAEGNGFYENGYDQVLSQTFHGKLFRDLSYHLVTTFDLAYFQNRYLADLRENIDRTKEKVLSVNSSGNNFIYGHFILPHYPYLYDSSGNALGYKQAMNAGNRNNYLGYLEYCNGFFLQLIDAVQKKDPDAIIVLMSDHGFTKYQDPRLLSYNFSNFISIYYPDRDYAHLPDTLTNINLFRTIFNKQFGLNLPQLIHQEVPLIEK